MRYYYKDFVTGKVRYTRGKFIGWSERTGPLHVHYAMFQLPSTYVNVPCYCLTAETKAALPPVPNHGNVEWAGKEKEEMIGENSI